MTDFFQAIFIFITDFLAALGAFLGDKSTFDEFAEMFGGMTGETTPEE